MLLTIFTIEALELPNHIGKQIVNGVDLSTEFFSESKKVFEA